MKKVAFETRRRMIARIINSLFQTLSSCSLSVWKANAFIILFEIPHPCASQVYPFILKKSDHLIQLDFFCRAVFIMRILNRFLDSREHFQLKVSPREV